MNLLLSCANGLSTSLLAQKIQKLASELGKECQVWAVDIESIEREIKNKKVDCILLAPQVQFARKEVKNIADQYGVPMIEISALEYGRMDAQKILDNILKILD